MIIRIDNPEGLKLDEFIITYLIPELRCECYSRLDKRLCDKWTNYFKSADLGWDRFGDKVVVPSAYDVIVAGIQNITYSKQGVDYLVFINNNEITPRGCAKLNDICHLINYGNLSVSPYPIFSSAFKAIDKRVNELYNLFLEGH